MIHTESVVPLREYTKYSYPIKIAREKRNFRLGQSVSQLLQSMMEELSDGAPRKRRDIMT
ncbi:hypothetical protein BJX99DRAFT_224002 [Aspergillus californicus]